MQMEEGVFCNCDDEEKWRMPPCTSSRLSGFRGPSRCRSSRRNYGSFSRRFGSKRNDGGWNSNGMVAFDFLMTENWASAKYAIALLIVMIEQAVLDAGQFGLGQLLTLQEDVLTKLML